MENLSFQYPAWFIIFCLLAGLVYAAILYYRDQTFREQSNWLNWILGSVRFITVTLLCLLLMSPLVKSIQSQTQKPVIVIAQDASESIAAAYDSTQINEYAQSLQSLRDNLATDYEVETFSFGDSIQNQLDFAFDDKVSNISQLFSTVYDLYSNRNLGAIVLATDGIYNEGSNPLYQSKQLTAPLYTVALGDTTPKKDVILKRVFHNNIAYLGDKFSAQIDLAAQNFDGQNVSLQIGKVENGRVRNLQQIPIRIEGKNFFTTKEVILEAQSVGVQRYRVQLTTLSGEVSTLNNVQDFFIDVLDARQKILILAHSPHPDLSALKSAITRNKNYEVTLDYANNLQVNPDEFDLVILHQLPDNTGQSVSLISRLNAQKIPRLYIVGSATNLQRLNGAQTLLAIQGDGRNTNDVQADFNTDFSLFTMEQELRQQLSTYPPLIAPFGDFNVLGSGQVLLSQKIGNVSTGYPLLVLGEVENVKEGILAAEGLWKWRLFDYLQTNNHDQVDDFVRKIVQYLSLKEDKRRFRVSLGKNIFNENESLLFNAELYNASFELVNGPDVTLVITDENGRNFEFVFNKKGKAYFLDAKSLPVGNYTYRAQVFTDGRQLTYNGQFSVQPIQLELYETTADHNFLRNLSQSLGGTTFFPGQMSDLEATIREKDTIKPVLYQTSKTKSVIHFKWIFFLLLFLLTVEWFCRRYFGAY